MLDAPDGEVAPRRSYRLMPNACSSHSSNPSRARPGLVHRSRDRASAPREALAIVGHRRRCPRSGGRRATGGATPARSSRRASCARTAATRSRRSRSRGAMDRGRSRPKVGAPGVRSSLHVLLVSCRWCSSRAAAIARCTTPEASVNIVSLPKHPRRGQLVERLDDPAARRVARDLVRRVDAAHGPHQHRRAGGVEPCSRSGSGSRSSPRARGHRRTSRA